MGDKGVSEPFWRGGEAWKNLGLGGRHSLCISSSLAPSSSGEWLVYGSEGRCS